MKRLLLSLSLASGCQHAGDSASAPKSLQTDHEVLTVSCSKPSQFNVFIFSVVPVPMADGSAPTFGDGSLENDASGFSEHVYAYICTRKPSREPALPKGGELNGIPLASYTLLWYCTPEKQDLATYVVGRSNNGYVELFREDPDGRLTGLLGCEQSDFE